MYHALQRANKTNSSNCKNRCTYYRTYSLRSCLLPLKPQWLHYTPQYKKLLDWKATHGYLLLLFDTEMEAVYPIEGINIWPHVAVKSSKKCSYMEKGRPSVSMNVLTVFHGFFIQFMHWYQVKICCKNRDLLVSLSFKPTWTRKQF